MSVLVGDDKVVDATFQHGGVRVRPLTQLLAEASATEHRALPVHDEAAALAFLLGQVGRPYDWGAIVGWFRRGGWARADAWFCSELVPAAAAAGGLALYRPEAWRITPGHLWMLA